MAKGLAYTLGKHWKLTGIAATTVLAIGCWPERELPPAAPVATPAAPGPSCLEDKTMLVAYDQHIQKNEHWKAARTIANCVEKTGDPSLAAKMRTAEANSREQDATDTKLSADDRLRAIEHLRDLDPERAAKLQSLAGQLEAAAKRDELKREAAAKKEADAAKRRDLAERKKQGVSIGMTAQEVLQSSWGRPESINRTTSKYGVREQWVYGGRNYLYFRDGKLETIQN